MFEFCGYMSMWAEKQHYEREVRYICHKEEKI